VAISNSFEELLFDRVDSMGRHVETARLEQTA
jgi:hypothetical protein